MTQPDGTGASQAAPSGQGEATLLLLCARTRSSPALVARIASLLREPLNWPALLSMANHHAVAPLLHLQLSRGFDAAVPRDILDTLSKRFEERLRRNLFLTAELLAQLRSFEAHGIEAIPWKGPALAAFAYGSLSLREFGDLDILIRERDLQKASELLRSRGYKRDLQLTPRQERAYLENCYEMMFINRERRVAIELHWAITPAAFAFDFDADSLWDHRVSLGLGGKTVCGMPPEYLLLTLCVHGSKHCWERLSLVCDVGELIQTCDRLNWASVTSLAREAGASRMLLLGLNLAHRFLGVNFPGDLRAAATADRKVMRLTQEAESAFFSQAAFSFQEQREAESKVHRTEESNGAIIPSHALWRTMRFHLAVKDGIRDRMRYLLGYLSPTVGDWIERPLPDCLFSLYYFIRPVRLLKKYGRLDATRPPATSKVGFHR